MKLLYRPNRTAKNNKCYVIEVEIDEWKRAGTSPFSQTVFGQIVWIGDKFDNSINKFELGVKLSLCNPFWDLLNYYNSDFNSFVTINEETFKKEFVEQNLGAYLCNGKN